MGREKVIKQVPGRQVRFGGEEHSGWLPLDAARPEPTPVRIETLDVRILDLSGAGYLLEWVSREGDVYADFWYETIEDAEDEAQALLGIERDEWAPPDEEL